jgi:NAD(P)-dependent dehydrogenase (short-subunit alcohol dehydrogenase family)
MVRSIILGARSWMHWQAHALMRNWANEYGEDGITFNTISPGLIDTGLSDYLLKDGASKGHKRKEEQPVIFSGRMGEVDEISGFTVFMLTGRSSYITGQNLTGAFLCSLGKG